MNAATSFVQIMRKECVVELPYGMHTFGVELPQHGITTTAAFDGTLLYMLTAHFKTTPSALSG